ncbi:hypothetical protein F5984_20615 [Rudanella paleaurantiibacter]|uniref:Uncharacterized protein n=1 Tax=Rudanella paleaurantiibacter TaxID=2614655 RepID=A0A7J5TVI0_9BACT|nr:hypothetical protein [Rudanella paleaurantiibacter]KAB7728151.1 hypothetical protein F5984_20615 [Rudanella paleaurantiibacter]
MTHWIRTGAHEGKPLHMVTDLPFLTRYRDEHKGAELRAIDARIRELRQLGYGRCRPTPKLPYQP